MRCPICKRDLPPRPENPAFPFCSERCRLVDLGKWLNAEYRVPGEPALDEASVGEEPEPVESGK